MTIKTEQADYFFQLGNQAFTEKNYRHALTQFEAAIAADVSAVYPHLNAGICEMLLGDPKKAIKHFDFAILLNSNDSLFISNWTSCPYSIFSCQRYTDVTLFIILTQAASFSSRRSYPRSKW